MPDYDYDNLACKEVNILRDNMHETILSTWLVVHDCVNETHSNLTLCLLVCAG